MTHIIMYNEAVLRRLPLLSSLGATQFKGLLPSLRRRSVAARTCILHAGDIPDSLYIIVSGRVRLRHEDETGRALIAESFGPNEFFGEMGIMEPAPCPASIEAAENCELVCIPRERLVECLAQSSVAAMSMFRVALKRLTRAHCQMANLALTTVYTRVAQVLLENGQELNGAWHVTVRTEEIAEMVGASREMVSRVLRCMIEKRVVKREKRKLIVLDRDAFSAQPSRHDSRGFIGSAPPEYRA